MKALKFIGSSLDDLRNFPDEARRAAGFELRALQNGLEPSDWKPMQSVAPGVSEIRVHILGEWRVIYVSKDKRCDLCASRFSKEESEDEPERYRTCSQEIQTDWRQFMNTVVNSSGNVFIDLGYSPDEAAILQMRADLMANLRKFIKVKKLTQAKAAEIFGVSQSRVSDLTTGKWEKFSLEMLITLATKAGMHVTLKTAA